MPDQKSPREIIKKHIPCMHSYRPYDKDGECSECERHATELLSALDTYYESKKDNRPSVVYKRVNGEWIELYIDNEDVLKQIKGQFDSKKPTPKELEESINDILNDLGKPVMSYEPSIALKEYDELRQKLYKKIEKLRTLITHARKGTPKIPSVSEIAEAIPYRCAVQMNKNMRLNIAQAIDSLLTKGE